MRVACESIVGAMDPAVSIPDGKAMAGSFLDRSADDLLDTVGEGQITLLDRGYDSDALRAAVVSGAWAKPMPNRVKIPAFSRWLYRYGNLVERFFNKLKHFRAIATNLERHEANYLALVKIADFGCGL
jgi:transposase